MLLRVLVFDSLFIFLCVRVDMLQSAPTHCLGFLLFIQSLSFVDRFRDAVPCDDHLRYIRTLTNMMCVHARWPYGVYTVDPYN